ncbi:hypothetical protein BB560_006105 [Smittium megazygosporum]|uniref:Uncharacterized protein n=1 Tax=Smittium megazygosporum TaxID=133381 RepID=A0A2T9YHE9_9FUNG|nr:hypothetical protein BB560_006105 [Smittium megazygosporum]
MHSNGSRKVTASLNGEREFSENFVLAENFEKLSNLVEGFHENDISGFHLSLANDDSNYKICPFCNYNLDIIRLNSKKGFPKTANGDTDTVSLRSNNSDFVAEKGTQATNLNEAFENLKIESPRRNISTGYGTPILKELRFVNDLNHKEEKIYEYQDSKQFLRRNYKLSGYKRHSNLYSYPHDDKDIGRLLGRWQSWFIESDPDLTAADNESNKKRQSIMVTKTLQRPKYKNLDRLDSNSTKISTVRDSSAESEDISEHEKNTVYRTSKPTDRIFAKSRFETTSSFKAPKKPTNKDKASKLVIKLLMEELKTLQDKQSKLCKRLETLNPTIYSENVSRREISTEIKNIQGLIDIKSEEISILSSL